jgi:hypothetical protein
MRKFLRVDDERSFSWLEDVSTNINTAVNCKAFEPFDTGFKEWLEIVLLNVGSRFGRTR